MNFFVSALGPSVVSEKKKKDLKISIMSSSSEEDAYSTSVPPGLFNERKESIPAIVDEPTSYDSPPGLFFDQASPKTTISIKSAISEDSFDPPGIHLENPSTLKTRTARDTSESIPKLSVLKSDDTWFGDDIEADQVEYEEEDDEEDPPGLFLRENQDELKKDVSKGLLRTASSRTLKIMKRVRSNNMMKTREESKTQTEGHLEETKRNDSMMPPPGSLRHPSVFTMNILQGIEQKSADKEMDKTLSFSCLSPMMKEEKAFEFEIEDIPDARLSSIGNKNDAVEYIQSWYRALNMKKSCERLSNASRVLGRFFAMCALKYCHHAWYERMHSSCERGDLESVLKLLRRDGRYRRLHFTQVIQELNRSLECGEVFLHAAVRSKSLPLVSALISHGASVSKRDFNGETPVFLSIREGDESLSITKYLIEMYQGKDYHKYLEIRNQLGETPCDVAMLLNGEDSKHIQTVTFLWERGAATTPETEACMFLLQESSKRNKIIKEEERC